MILDTFGQLGESASARYVMLNDGWRGLLMQALDARDFGSPAQASRIVREAYALAEVFLDAERGKAIDDVSEIATEAHQTTLREIASNDTAQLEGRALDHLAVTQSYLIDELTAQINRDIALLRQTLQRIALEVSLAARSRGISQRTALIEYRIGNANEIRFMFYDRAGRKWTSQKFVRALWRHTLLAVYNETVMLTLADHGITRAQVWHVSPEADAHGMLISFGSNSELPTYSEIRDTVFHPNANAILRMEGTDVSA